MVSTTGAHGAPVGHDVADSSRRTTSPGCACRPSFDFSNTGRPSLSTSKRPPPDGLSSTFASGYFARISAAKLVARGS